jgi:NTP pyrophosphatase (non-canonical NTP hydrolase)
LNNTKSNAERAYLVYVTNQSWDALYQWFMAECLEDREALRQFGHHDQDKLQGRESRVQKLAEKLRTIRYGGILPRLQIAA